MHTQYPHLFEPITIRGYTFRNRIVAAPTGSWLITPKEYAYDYGIEFFEDRARGGCAEVIIGDTEVNAELPDQDSVGMYINLRQKEGSSFLNQVADAVQHHGAHLCLQLNHSGEYYGPSPRKNKFRTTKAMTELQIWTAIEQFRTCAERLREVGLHMVMLHGAHGWLLDQFFNPVSNHRTDRWGGSLENRMRFPLEVAKAVREAIGEKMLLEYRISGCDPELDPVHFEETVALINALSEYIDIVHVSAGGSDGTKTKSAMFPTYLSELTPNTYLAGAIRQRVNLPVTAVGAVTTPELAERVLAEGQADFVAMCRPLIADPELPRKARTGHSEEIRPCIGCHMCLDEFHRSHINYCSVNSVIGAEHRVRHQMLRVTQPQKVVVIGGGPVGMEAAIRAWDKGHHVTILEKADRLGGLLCHADDDPIKYRLKAYKDYMVRQVEKRDIEVLLNTEATPERVMEMGPDAVIAAVGSTPIVPKLPGVDRANVRNALNVFADGSDYAGKKVAVIGGNLVGCEVAIALKEQGAEVTLCEMTGRIHLDANEAVAVALEERLEGVAIRTRTRCTEIGADSVSVEGEFGQENISADFVVLAVGMRPNREASEEFRYTAGEFFCAGDCVQARTLFQGVREGFWAAMDV